MGKYHMLETILWENEEHKDW